MRFSTRPVLLALSVGTLLLTACASDSESSDAGADTEAVEGDAADGDTAASFNDADVVFTQGMIPHHRQAIEMAEMALAPEAEASAEVQALATQIQGAQDPEIETMTGLLESWGQPIPEMAESGMEESSMDESGMDESDGGHDMDSMGDDDAEDMESMDGMESMEGMEGMMSADEMSTLASLTGTEFDAAWIAAMIAHHEGAVSMSESVKASGSNAEVLALADQIIAGQQAELDEMRALSGS